MAVMELNASNFDALTNQAETIVIDFWAEWCGPCKSFAKVFETVSHDYETSVVFAKVDIEAEKTLAEELNIRSVPFLMVIRQSVAVFSDSGAMTGGALRDLLDQALALDMDEVRKNIENKQE